MITSQQVTVQSAHCGINKSHHPHLNTTDSSELVVTLVFRQSNIPVKAGFKKSDKSHETTVASCTYPRSPLELQDEQRGSTSTTRGKEEKKKNRIWRKEANRKKTHLKQMRWKTGRREQEARQEGGEQQRRCGRPRQTSTPGVFVGTELLQMNANVLVSSRTPTAPLLYLISC